MARINDVALINRPADDEGPRLICCYQVDVLDAPQLGEDGKKFKFDPQRMLYALAWKHKAVPADLELQLVRDPVTWFNYVATLLLGALNRADPTVRAAAIGLVGPLD